MTTSSRTSVIVPMFNGSATISDTLDSLALQTLAPHEVIVVDDGSDDGGVDLVRSHPIEAKVLRLSGNHGVGFARNSGMAEATGEFLAVMDQDDLWVPWRLAQMERVLATHPETRLIVSGERVFATESSRVALADHPFGGWVELWCADDDALSLFSQCPEPAGDPGLSEIPRKRIISGSVTVTTSYVFDRRLARSVGGFASWLRSADDWVFLQAMAAYTPVYRVEADSVLYRVHPSNTSNTTDWPMPLALTAAAVRRGGRVVSRGRERDRAEVGALGDSEMLMHVLRARVAARERYALLDTAAAVHLLATDQKDRRQTARALARVGLSARTPDGIKRLLRAGRRK